MEDLTETLQVQHIAYIKISADEEIERQRFSVIC